MKNYFLTMLLCVAQAFVFVSCEKAYMGEKENQVTSDGINVEFRVKDFEQIPFDGFSRVELGNVCTRIDMAVFNGTEKIKTVKQEDKDEHFGTLSLSLAQGTYQIVIVAHKGAGAATITSPDEITFKNNKVTDTFYHYAEIKVDESKTYEVSMKRAVAMFRLIVNDRVPEDIVQMQLYYTGGSSTFNAKTGFGSKNSRQTEIRDVPSSAHGASSQYEIYSFPHEMTGNLKITVSALNSSGETVTERIFENVPITINKITQYVGDFFGTSQGGSQGSNIVLKVTDEWQLDDYSY